jgi:hypothetical protein
MGERRRERKNVKRNKKKERGKVGRSWWRTYGHSRRRKLKPCKR